MKKWISLALLALVLAACDKQVISNPKLQIEALCLGAYGCFSFESANVLVGSSSLETPILLQSNREATPYYSYLNEPYRPIPNTGLLADSGQPYLFFTAQTPTLGSSAQKRIQLQWGSHNFLESLQFQVQDKRLNLNLTSLSRGVMVLEIYNLVGVNLGTRYFLVDENLYQESLSLNLLNPGTYTAKITYGVESISERIVIN